tara:strand:+ start:717 stop:1211 length:495 start_codon:yes stop_codon:yes gene_type:complete
MLVRPVNKVISINNNEKEIKMTRYTTKTKKEAITRLKDLTKNGVALNAARAVVVSEFGIKPATLARWQSSFKTVKTTDLITKQGTTHQSTNLMVKSSNGAINGLEMMKDQLGVVFRSLVTQDGRFTNKDASAISVTANVILGCCKQVLLERKAINKLHKTEHLT